MLSEILTRRQVCGLLCFGALFWAAAAVAIRSAPEALLGNVIGQIMCFVGIFPVSYGAIRLTEAVLGISPVARVDSVAVMLAIATLLDGVALMWFPVIYENSALMKANSSLAMFLSRRGGAWILWGVGAALVLSLLSSSPQTSTSIPSA